MLSLQNIFDTIAMVDKQHPELAGELHDVLERAREKVLADGED